MDHEHIGDRRLPKLAFSRILQLIGEQPHGPGRTRDGRRIYRWAKCWRLVVYVGANPSTQLVSSDGKPSASRPDRKTHAARLSWMDEELIKLGPTAPRSPKPPAYLALPIAALPPAGNAAPSAADPNQGMTTAIPPA
jgi:hypothetical protein